MVLVHQFHLAGQKVRLALLDLEYQLGPVARVLDQYFATLFRSIENRHRILYLLVCLDQLVLCH